METEFVEPADGQRVAQVGQSRGNNLHEVVDETGERYLASMPTKFRNTVWIKRGQFVVVEAIEEGDKVKGEIVNVLDEESILHLENTGRWPAHFADEADKMKRSTKRNIPEGMNSAIDPDMLPPSDSEEESDEEDGAEDEEGSSDEEDEAPIKVYNPNRAR
uniref:Probable RNA-binding protein EIF1AD n=1 Tax=Panagrellus redivivus TaxID=6233 RepID=A0A7E4ZYW6_PANRE